jgi:hypothetical protein
MRTIFIILLAGICAMGLFLYRDWLTLMHTPREDIQAAAGSLVPPPAYSLTVAPSYPPLFDVTPPAPLAPETTDTDTEEEPAKDQDFDGTQLQTPAGLLRVRALFIKNDTRIALLEILTDKSASLLEVRENDLVHGYRVIETGANHIRLSPEGEGDTAKLVIFDRKDPGSETAALPEPLTKSSSQAASDKQKINTGVKQNKKAKSGKNKNTKETSQKQKNQKKDENNTRKPDKNKNAEDKTKKSS